MSLIKKIEWNTKSGLPVVVTLEIQTSREADADGEKVTVPCCDMGVTATVDGQPVGYHITEIDSAHPAHKLGAVAICGNLCIPQSNYMAIKAAQAELESSPEWQAKVARGDKANKEQEAYDAHQTMMRNVMGY